MVKLLPNVRKLVDHLATDPDVVKLAGPLEPMQAAMTQHGYAAWASRIDTLASALAEGKDPSTNLRIVAAEALRTAGGNGQGIDSAMHAMFGVSQYDPMNAMFG